VSLQTIASPRFSRTAPLDERREPVTSHRTLVFSNPADGRDADYNAWYDDHHVPEVLDHVPGYVAAQRYRCSEHQR
jgi:hypothetical protein